MSLPLLPILPNVLEISTLVVQNVPNCELKKAIEEAKDQHSVDMERRAKIALQRAINRINVGNRL